MSLDTTPPDAPKRRRGLKVALIGAGVVAGAIGATAYGASAAETSSSGSTAVAYGASAASGAASAAPSGAPAGRPANPGGAQPVRSDEKAVTGAQEATLKAAALKAVPGATVIRIETDAGDGVYEAHLKKADGTIVTVKFDKNLKVTKVESGMGTGDPAPTR